MGLKILRKTLYFPAITEMKFNPSLKFFADNLRGKRQKTKTNHLRRNAEVGVILIRRISDR